jgi:hypothetical protein
MRTYAPVALLLSIFFLGCEPSGAKFKVTPASGTVTMSGQPVADAQLILQYEGTPPPEFPGAGAQTDSSGKFAVTAGTQQGTIPGKYKVAVSKLTKKDGSPIPSGDNGIDLEQLRMQGEVVDAIPAPYNNLATSPLTLEVKEDKPEGYEIQIAK